MIMWHSSLPRQLLCLLFAITVSAQRLAEDLSFGHKDAISPNGRGIPGWSVSSSNHNPQILSDRIVLTPPVPGNARGALWGDNAVNAESWTAEISFRASGQDSGSGNLQFWYAKDKNQINIDSVYTAGQFDGPWKQCQDFPLRHGSPPPPVLSSRTLQHYTHAASIELHGALDRYSKLLGAN